MLRRLHRWPGLLAAVLLLALSISGVALSVFPAMEAMSAPPAVMGQSVGDLAARVLAAHPTVEQIRRAPSGRITAYWFDGDRAGAAVIDPATGLDAGTADPSAVKGWLTDFHRAFLMEDAGRWTAAAAALAMLVLGLTGAALVAARQGGWSRWFAPMRGPVAGRWHGEVARVAAVTLILSALTGLWMTGATFGLLPDDAANPAFPDAVSGAVGLSPDRMTALATIPVDALRDLTFPYAGDATDAFAITTADGAGFVDQGTGALLVWQANGPWARIGEWVYLLHTGEGAAIWGLLLGLLTLAVPVLAVTGVLIWLARRRVGGALKGMTPAAMAETVILVASEGGTTWGFAKALGQALIQAGGRVHLAPLAPFAPDRFAKARQIVIMAATWGEGEAPASARGVVERITALPPHPVARLAVLGFGDRSFPSFCGFAEELEAAARAAGWQALLPLDRIDRQSAQGFARWSRALGDELGVALDVHHQSEPPRSTALTLIQRQDHGEAVQAPTAILRFALPRRSLTDRLMGRGLGAFRPGDLLGILPQGSQTPRFYSLASGSADGFVEIVVRKHPGGLCSGQLLDLMPGQTVQAFVKANPGFRAEAGSAPLILVGAGTGIGPLAGFIRANDRGQPMHLWFGARHPASDFLYGDDLRDWLDEGRLTALATAFSRTGQRHYVQDRLRADAGQLRDLMAQGARIMVCGGREMAQGVRETLTDILAPMGLTLAALKEGGRYAEDSY